MNDKELNNRLDRIQKIREQRTEQMRRYREKRKNDSEKVLKDKEKKSIYMKRYTEKPKKLDIIAIETANERNDIIINCNKKKENSFTSDMIVNNINEFNDIPIPNHIKTGIKGLKTNTAKAYSNKICIIHKKKFNYDLDNNILYNVFINNYDNDDVDYIINNMGYLNDCDNIINLVNSFYTPLNSQYSYIVPFLTLISYIEKLYNVSYKDLALYLRKLRDKIEKQRGDNKIKEGKAQVYFYAYENKERTKLEQINICDVDIIRELYKTKKYIEQSNKYDNTKFLAFYFKDIKDIANNSDMFFNTIENF